MPVFGGNIAATNYLFVDAAYFREAFNAMMVTFYGVPPTIDWTQFRAHFGSPQRVYYYDAIDRGQVGDETSEQREQRIKKADLFHRYLNSLPYFHVREGFVSRGRRASRRSQKAVDVQLAVDALEHAVAHNMTQASFILGDLDFEPLFFSLNRFGIHVTVYYEEGTAAEELLEAADISMPIQFNTCNYLVMPAFKATHVVPTYGGNNDRPLRSTRLRKGIWNGRLTELLRDNESDTLYIWAAPGTEPGEHSLQANYHALDQAKAELAYTMQFGGTIQWDE